MEENSPYKEAYLYSIRLLTRRDYSAYKLKNKILDKGYSKIIAEEVTEELLKKKYLREDYYAEARIKALIHKGHAKSYITQKLAAENVIVSDDLVNNIYDEYQISEESQIHGLIQKKIKNVEDLNNQKIKEKTIRFLLVKGHSLEKTLCALKKFPEI